MVYITLIHNLALLIALSIISGFIAQRCRRHEMLMQGLAFGSTAVIGMIHPLVIDPGLIFDGRSMMISLCGLFFGPTAVSIAGGMAIICRIVQGGAGARMGILVILSSALVGLMFHRQRDRSQTEFTVPQLWLFGLTVHTAMLMMTAVLPPELVLSTLKKIGWPVIICYPLATILAGKILSDQRARIRLMNELRQRKEEFRTTLYSIGDAVISTNIAGQIRQMNPEAELLTGWSEQEAAGQPLEAVFHIIKEDSLDAVENPAKRALRTGRISGLANHTLLVARDGTKRPISDSAAPIRNSSGLITGVVLVFRDQTSERTAKYALQESEERFRNLFNQAPLGYQSLDGNGCFIEVNQTWLDTLGYSREEVIGKWFGDFLAPDYVDLFRQRFPLFKTKGSVQTSFWMIHKNGSRRLIAFDGRIGHNPDGSFKQTHCILSDITDKKLAEDALRRAEQEWTATFDATEDAICLLDKNQKIIRCNHSMEVLTGLGKSELGGKSCWDVVHQGTVAIENCPVQKMMVSKKREWLELQIADCWYEVTADPLMDDNGEIQGAVHIIRDITARKTAEASLKRLEWMLSKKTADTAVPTRKNYGDLTALNQNGIIIKSVGREMLEQITGDYMTLLGTSSAIYEANGDYAFGSFNSDWCQLMDRSSRALCRTADNSAALSSGQWLCHESCWSECAKKTISSGKPADIECSGGIHLYALPIFANGKVIGAINFGYGDPPRDPAKLRQLASTYRLDYNELLNSARRYDSRPPYIIEMAKERLKASARLIGLLVEIKLSEKQHEELEIQLRQSQKMEAIGRLAGGVAHDFNNMLQVILGRTEMLLNTVAPDTAQADSLTEITKAAQRSADLTRQLLAFARKQTISPVVLDMNTAIDLTLGMLRRLIGENIDLRWMPVSVPVQIKMDPSQLNQILTNLTVNARDAIKDTGWIRIETNSISFDEDYCRTHSGFLPGKYALLTVTDSGCGMDKETCQHLFEPFFTTKSTGQGSGLGLATLYGIVRQNNGFINVYSEVGQGAVFKIYLPLYTGDGKIQEIPVPRTETPRGKETILLVEDEETLLALGRAQLEDLGYTVLASSVPVEAARLAAGYKNPIQLLVTDVVMPEMSGLELSQKIKKQHPKIKILFMSGYTADIITRHGVLHDDLNFLQKPFSKEALAQKIREVLAAP